MTDVIFQILQKDILFCNQKEKWLRKKPDNLKVYLMNHL